MKLMERAKRVNLMSIDELVAFEHDVRAALVSGKLHEKVRDVLNESFVESIGRLNRIREQQLAQVVKPVEESIGHPKDYWAKIRDDIGDRLKNPRLEAEQKASLARRYEEADSVVRNWGKIDAEQQKIHDTRKQHLDAQAAIDAGYK
jgi:hypothetical protein